MICVTTHTIERNEIRSYCGIVAVEVVCGINWVSDIANELRDAWGARGREYERHLKAGREQAMEDLKSLAKNKGGNAIVAVDFSYQVLGGANGMLMVAATGTAVVIEKNAEELRKDEAHKEEHAAEHYVDLGDGEKGPFSIAQLRELAATDKIGITDLVRTEGSSQLRSIAHFHFGG